MNKHVIPTVPAVPAVPVGPVVTDITGLYIEEMMINSLTEQFFLWYRYDEIFDDVTIEDKDNKQILDENLDSVGFPEYKPIAYAIINFAEENIFGDDSDSDYSDSDDSDSDSTDLHIINVMVDQRSKYAKGHTPIDETGFIKLFTLIFDEDYTIQKIAINVKLVSEKITLTSGKKNYPILPEDATTVADASEDVQNDTDCSVCLLSTGTLVETPCKHKFHLQCLRCVPKLRCPLCRQDITEFLENNGISKEEIQTRLRDQKNEAELEEVCQALDNDYIANLASMEDIDFIRACMYTLKLNNGDTIAYQDLIFDMNANASELFAEISFIKSGKEKGLFVYHFESATDLICQMLDKTSPSFVQWCPASQFKDTQLENMINNRIGRITDTRKQYVVLILIENIANAHIVERYANKNPTAFRIHHRDILNSLLKCIRCRCSGNSHTEPNREYAWARDKLKSMKRKNNKNNKKGQKSHKQK